MVITMPRPKKSAAKDQRPETLAEFAAQLNDHAGRDVEFDALVRRLLIARQQLAQATEARKQLRAGLHIAYTEHGLRTVGDTGYQLRLSQPGPATTYRTVMSADVKKADPAAWRRAQAVVSYVQVKASYAERQAVPTLEVPNTAALWNNPVAATVALKEAPVWKLMRGLRDTETETVERLDKLAADFGWDGLPLTFADGWTVGLRRRQFSADHLAAVDPEAFDRLAVTRVRQTVPTLYVATLSQSDEAVDLDGD